jgi:hypothetical protein
MQREALDKRRQRRAPRITGKEHRLRDGRRSIKRFEEAVDLALALVVVVEESAQRRHHPSTGAYPDATNIIVVGRLIGHEDAVVVESYPHLELGYGDDERDYGVGSRILLEAGYHRVILMTNNPRKVQGISIFGVEVVERRPAEIPPLAENYRYLKSKKEKLGHLLDGV